MRHNVTEERVFDQFDSFAKNYRDIHNNNIKVSGVDSDFFSEYKVLEIKKYITCNDRITILDLGCGDGNTSFYLNKHFPNAKIYGLDVSKESIEIAQSRGLQSCLFDVYDGLSIPFKDEHFDLVLIACVLHHVDYDYHQKLLSETYRILKDKACLFIFEHNPNNPLTRKIVKDCIFDRDAILLKPSYTKKLLNTLHYKTEIYYTIFFPRRGFFNKLLFLERSLNKLPLGGQYYAKSIKRSRSS